MHNKGVADSSIVAFDWKEVLVTSSVWGICGLVLLSFSFILFDIFSHGLSVLSWDFLLQDVRASGREGGIAPVLVSTLMIVASAIAIAFPLSIGTALFLVEFMPSDSRTVRWIENSIDVLASVPSIVFGLFGNALFCDFLGFGYSLLSGSLTLVCMILPFMIKVAIDNLRAVPQEYRYAGSALALSKAVQIRSIFIPYAMEGFIAGALLGIARALAETAALLFTSGYVSRMPESMMDSGRTISIHIYDLSMNVSGGDTAAYGSATILILMLLLINMVVIGLGRMTRVGR
ncbi:MAG: phosphate ABC transporter permease PstA [Cocleimonas sp.]|nr:phosphate ABC transporter permease PstA [Cocleimonas sp.]